MPQRAATATWVRDASDELAVAEGCRFDEARARRAVDFVERFCRHSVGRWAGRPLELLPWQRDYAYRLYGWVDADGLRRYRRAYLEVPKKNGKTTLLSAFGLYHLVGDGEPVPEVYILAGTIRQSGIMWREASRMVHQSPALAKRLECKRSESLIEYPARDGRLEACSGEVDAKDGINASATLFDELHRQPGPELFEIMEFAGAARSQPLLWSITTAGASMSSICWDQHEYSLRVASGEIRDWRHLGVVYGARKGDDYLDPAVWRRANPSLGHTISESDFAAELSRAKRSARAWTNALRLRLNVWAEGIEVWLPSDKWAATRRGLPDDAVLAGLPCWIGVDLSATTDLTAIAGVWDAGDGLLVRTRFFAPSDRAAEAGERDAAPYLAWARDGHLEIMEGAIIDLERIREVLVDWWDTYDVRAICMDPWHASLLATRLRDEDGCTVKFVSQRPGSIGPAAKELERRVLGDGLRCEPNPCLDWCVANCGVATDGYGNLAPRKIRRTRRIDGVSATLSAIAGYLADQASAPTPSPYRHRGLRTV